MRISELAETTGVSVATIKYYLREGLVPPGTKVGERRSEYDDTHVRRLHLLRVLREVGDVPVDALRGIVDAVERAGSVHETFAAVADALVRPRPAADADKGMREFVDGVVEQAGWTGVRPESCYRDDLAAVLGAIVGYGTHTDDTTGLQRYVAAADDLARWEIGNMDASKDRLGLLEEMIVGEVVFGQLFLALRGLAHEHHSRERFGEQASRKAARGGAAAVRVLRSPGDARAHVSRKDPS